MFIGNKPFALLLLLVLLYTATFSQYKVRVKYSINDCILCNMKVNELVNIDSNTKKEIVFKKFDSIGNQQILALCKKIDITPFYSSEKYYQYDSSERSMLYLLQNDSVIYSSYLKEFDLSRVVQFVNADRAVGDVRLSDNIKIAFSKDKFAVLDKTTNIVSIISKENLCKIEKSISTNNIEERTHIYKENNQFDWMEQIAIIDSLRQNTALPLKNKIKDIRYIKDTLFVMASLPVIVDSVGLSNIVAISKYYLNQYISTSMLIYKAKYDFGNRGKYKITTSDILTDGHEVYFAIHSDSINEGSRLIAKARIMSNTYISDSLLDIFLPRMHLENHLGYNLLPLLMKGPLFMVKIDNKLFNLQTRLYYELPFYLEKNNVTKEKMKDLNFKIRSSVIDLYLKGNKIFVLYSSNDSLNYACCSFVNNKLKLEATPKNLTSNIRDPKYFQAVFYDEKTLLTYDKKLTKFTLLQL